MAHRVTTLRSRRDTSGFTLIELLVVIIILGILAAVVVFAVSGVGDKGKDSAMAIDRRTLQTAQEVYFGQNGRYTSEAGLVAANLLSDESDLHEIELSDGPCNGRPAAADSCYLIIRAVAPDTLDVAFNFDQAAWTTNFRSGVDMCEPLTKSDESYQLQPQLATGWTYMGPAAAPAPASGTGDRWRFTLRPGVKFHDGSDFDADDVVYSVQWMAAKNRYTGATRLNANSAVAIDPQTVDLTTTVPNAQLPAQLSHPITSIIATGSDPHNPSISTGCTGSYRFVSYTAGDKLVVTRFDDYWGSLAKIRQINFFENGDANARRLALQSGQVDLAREIPRDNSLSSGLGNRLKVIQAQQGATLLIQMNAVKDNNPGPGATDNANTDPILAEAAVRKALTQAIDRPALIANGLAGQALTQASLSPPGVLGSAASLVQGSSTNTTAAASILDGAGWNSFDVDGTRMKGARRLELNLYYQTETVGTALPALLQQQVAALGFDVNLNTATAAQTTARRVSGDYDLILGSTNQGDASASALSVAWSYTQSFTPPGDPTLGGGSTAALGRWSVPTSTYDIVGDPDFGKTYDQLVSEGLGSPVPATTATKTAKAQHILIDQDATYIIVAGMFRIWGAHEDLHYKPHPNYLQQRWNETT